MTADQMGVFHDRARYEAARYGADTWVFVRELLQNARDAGASSVRFDVSSTGGVDRIACRDDGCGMTFAHARDYLFTLYASSKHGERLSAGRFGIGFWSLLRFSPSAITVRSRSVGHPAWQVRLDRDLNLVSREAIRFDPGTEIVVERRANGEDVEDLLRAAVLRDAPFLTQRARPDRPLDVRINGRVVRAPFELPPPSLSFRRRGLRGVVALGSEPRVEVFAHGLRVRDAAGFDDLLLTGRRGRSRAPALSSGLAPHALIDSSGLTVLLARGDAREDRALRRLVRVGHREVRRLVRAELDRATRPSLGIRLVERFREIWAALRIPLVVGAVVLLVLGAFAGRRIVATLRTAPSGVGPFAVPEQRSASRSRPPAPYSDLGNLYRGPAADALAATAPAVELGYRPADARPLFAALLIAGIDAEGAPLDEAVEDARIVDEPCVENCLDVALAVAADAGVLRLPVATGYVIDATSVRLNGEPAAVVGVRGGLPVVDLDGSPGGRLTYRSAGGAAPSARVHGQWPALPPELNELRSEIEGLPSEARASAAADWVRQRVVYDATVETARRHLEEQRRGRNLFERSLIVGAGDCDVQNALVAAILDSIGTPCRLAVGWVGSNGRVVGGLHAWVEYRGSDGRWRAVDASAPSGGGRGVSASRRDEAPHPRVRIRNGLVIASAVGVALLLVGVGLRFAGPAHHTFNPGELDGTADLVRAAAVDPGSFGAVHALYHRPVIPLVGGGAMSVARALDLAAGGGLAAGCSECGLAVRAAATAPVIDRGTPVGAAAAEAVGAVDLDDWQQLISRSGKDPVASRVERHLAAIGRPHRLRTAERVGEDVAVLDGTRFGLSSEARWLIIDRSSAVWSGVHDLSGRLPAAAALMLADSVRNRLGLSAELERTLLARLARVALDEGSRSSP